MIGIAGIFGIVRIMGWIGVYGYVQCSMVTDAWGSREIWESYDDWRDVRHI